MTARAGVLVGLAWLLTRATVVWLLAGRHHWVQGDLDYFATGMAAVPDQGLAQTLVEYPLPGVLVVALPWLLGLAAGLPDSYAALVVALSVSADAAFTLLLLRSRAPGRAAGLVVWLLAVPLLGATAYARFDLVPGLLAGVALLTVAAHPRLAAGAAAVATALKLWPALLLPALAARRSSRNALVSVVVITGGGLAVASAVAAGLERLVSPLVWQADRGLQIESVAATPAMVAWALRPGSYEIAYAEHNAFEVTGPGTDLLLRAADLAPLVAGAALVVLWVAAWRPAREVPVAAVAWMSLAAVSLFLVTSKVLSPQYLLWVLPLAAVTVAVTGSRGPRVWATVLLVATALTQLVFPELYVNLTRALELSGLAVLVLAVRNGVLVVLAGWALAAAWCEVSAAGRSSATRPGRRGGCVAPSGGVQTTPG